MASLGRWRPLPNMATSYLISEKQLSQIALCEREAAEIITLAGTLAALLKQREGSVVVGLSAEGYLRMLRAILKAIREEES